MEWVPRMRAMSLNTTNDHQEEENEIECIKKQLDLNCAFTMKLSEGLAELQRIGKKQIQRNGSIEV